jgi:hypothetical protein
MLKNMCKAGISKAESAYVPSHRDLFMLAKQGSLRLRICSISRFQVLSLEASVFIFLRIEY